MRASMRLDNRPKKLLIKDVGGDGVQAVRDWYEGGGAGQVDAAETLENGDMVVTFRTRAAAEQVRFSFIPENLT
jgi:RNA-binding protein 26